MDPNNHMLPAPKNIVIATRRSRPGWLILWIIAVAFVVAKPTDVAAALPAADQTATLAGYIRNTVTGAGLAGANVYFVDSQVGTATNIDGYFVFPAVPAGEYILEISYLGYRSLRTNIALEPGKTYRLNFELTPQTISLDSVVVLGQRIDQQTRNRVSQVQLGTHQLQSVPPIGEADLMRSLQTLPGVLSTSEYSSGLVIRGGNTDQNLILLDGITLYNPSHLFGLFSNFILDAVKEAELSKGGFNAEYGDRLSAVLNVRSRQGNQKHFDARGTVSLLAGQTTIEGPIGNGAWLLAFRRTYFDQIFKGTAAYFPYYFYDIQGHLFQDLTENDRLTISWYQDRDYLSFDDSNLSASWGNRAFSFNFQKLESSRLISNLKVAASWFDTRFNLGGISKELIADNWINDQFSMGVFSGNNSVNAIEDVTLGLNFTYFASQTGQVRFGAELKRYQLHHENKYLNRKVFDVDQTPWEFSAYGQWKQWLGRRLMVEPGLRMAYYDNHPDKWFADPRLQVKLLLTTDRYLNTAVGVYHQFLETAQDDFNPSLLSQWFAVDSTINPASAVHYIIGYEEYLGGRYRIQVEGYYKQLRNMLTFVEQRITAEGAQPSQRMADIFDIADGYAYGMEVFLQREYGRLTGWLAYSFSVARKRMVETEYYANWDRTHALNLVTAYHPSQRWEFSLNWTYQTGQPFTPVLGYYIETLPDTPDIVYRSIPGGRNSLRYPSYHRLDLGVTRHMDFMAFRMDAFVQAVNVYMQDNIFRQYYLFGSTTNQIDDDSDGEIDEPDEGIPHLESVSTFPFLVSIGVSIEI